MDVLAGIPAATLGHEVTMGMESMALAAEAEIKMEPSLGWHRATTGLDHQPEEDLSMKGHPLCWRHDWLGEGGRGALLLSAKCNS